MNKKRKKFYDWFCPIDLIVCTDRYELHNNHKDPNPEALVRIETFKARSGKKACKMCGRRLPYQPLVEASVPPTDSGYTAENVQIRVPRQENLKEIDF